MSAGTPEASVDITAVLNRLDWQLGEIGRREHRFAWLRDARSGDWLVVDAYYPGNRVVVVASADRALVALCTDLVPRNGLFLIVLGAEDLASDSTSAAKALRARLEIQGWEPRSDVPHRGERPVPAVPTGPAPVLAPARALGTPRALEAPRTLVSEPRSVTTPDGEDYDVPADVRIRPPLPAGSSPPGRDRFARDGRGSRPGRPRASQSEGMGVGITLVFAVVLELVVGGGVIGLGAGQYVLGFGFLLDACARVLGMIVASQNDDLDAAWTSVLFGSPALWGLADSERSDMAPVARLTAIIAGCVVALGLVLVIV